MERNSFLEAVRVCSRVSTAVAVSLLIGCSDSDSKKKSVPVTTLEFVRGDSNNDAKVDLADGIYTNNYLFVAGPPPSCQDAADADDNGILDLIDSVFTWNHLFRGGPTIAQPFPDLGFDDTADELTCESYALSSESPAEEELE